MEKVIQFQKNAEVINEKGVQLGSLERVVMNPNTKVITDLVIRGGTLFKKDEKVVSMDLVAATTTDVVVLRGAPHGLEDFPEFEEKRVVSDVEGEPNDQPPVIYGFGGTPIVVPNPREQLTTVTERNIPEGTVALKEGARVEAVGGKHVGNVESVLADPRADLVTHLAVSSGLLTKETKLVPIQWVKSLGEDKVVLRVKKESLQEIGEIAPFE